MTFEDHNCTLWYFSRSYSIKLEPFNFVTVGL